MALPKSTARLPFTAIKFARHMAADFPISAIEFGLVRPRRVMSSCAGKLAMGRSLVYLPSVVQTNGNPHGRRVKA